MTRAPLRFLFLSLPAAAGVAAAQGAAAPPEQVQLARQLLARHAENSRGVDVLLADYVQRRTTALLPEPLLSRGEFQFVREPPCVVFRSTAPRLSIVRLSPRIYEVYRPQRRQLERFHLDGPELAEGLFAAVGGGATLLVDFEVQSCLPDPEDGSLLRVRLSPKPDGPKHEALRRQLRELIVTLRQDGAALCAVAYRDHTGDLVEIELRALRPNPEAAPSPHLEVPPDTTVIEHRPTKSKG